MGSWRRRETSLLRIEDVFRDLLGLNFLGKHIKDTVKVYIGYTNKWRYLQLYCFHLLCSEWSKTVVSSPPPLLASAWLGTHLWNILYKWVGGEGRKENLKMHVLKMYLKQYVWWLRNQLVRTRLPEFKYWLLPLRALWSWVNHLPTQCPNWMDLDSLIHELVIECLLYVGYYSGNQLNNSRQKFLLLQSFYSSKKTII